MTVKEMDRVNEIVATSIALAMDKIKMELLETRDAEPNIVQDFVEVCCDIVGTPTTLSRNLYPAFTSFCEKNFVPKLTLMKFAKTLPLCPGVKYSVGTQKFSLKLKEDTLNGKQ